MTLLILEVAVVLMLVIIALIIAIRSFTKGPKKKDPFYMTNDDISNNLRSLMLSINRTEYIYGYRTEADYTKFIEDLDNSLMRG